ncbi:MAG: hypothetical protein AAB089_04025, partial [Nitrospirota bacterium]
MTDANPKPLITMMPRKRMFLKENILLFFGAAIIVIIIMTQTEFELYVPLVFGAFAAVFLFEKTLLGDSLKFGHLTIPSFFILLYIILMSFPSMLVFSEIDHPIKYTYFMAVQSVLITFPIGVGLANLMVNNSSIIITNFLYLNLTKTRDDLKFFPVFIVILISSFPILILYYLYAEYIQLIEVIKSYPTSIDIETLRFAQKTTPDIIHGSFELLRRFALPFCVLYAYFMSRVHKHRWKYMFWILFFATLIISSLTLDRAPPVALLIMMILAYILSRNQSVVKALNARLIIVFMSAMILSGFISVLQYQTAFTLKRVAENIWYVFYYRIMYDAAFMSSLAFQDFSDPALFLHGKSMRIVSLLGLDYTPAYPAGFVGDLWRNFGWFGVILGTIFIGF